MCILNRIGDIGHPCNKPFVLQNSSDKFDIIIIIIIIIIPLKIKVIIKSEKSKGCTFTMVIPLCGKKGLYTSVASRAHLSWVCFEGRGCV
jgi:hypothetical protein